MRRTLGRFLGLRPKTRGRQKSLGENGPQPSSGDSLQPTPLHSHLPSRPQCQSCREAQKRTQASCIWHIRPLRGPGPVSHGDPAMTSLQERALRLDQNSSPWHPGWPVSFRVGAAGGAGVTSRRVAFTQGLRRGSVYMNCCDFKNSY